jgi:FAD/FMN-containing dehydrogenase
MISHTGIAGLTLGGGFGLLCRKFGLAIDNLISADIVTSDGKLRTVSATQEPDLFWAIRGGGGNFGIVTSFEYQLHEVGPMLAGLIAYPLPQATQSCGAPRGDEQRARRADGHRCAVDDAGGPQGGGGRPLLRW